MKSFLLSLVELCIDRGISRLIDWLNDLDEILAFIFTDGGSPPGSHHSDNSSQQHPPRMPKLFARLTNKRSEMDPGDVGGRGNAHEPSEEEPDSAGSGSGLMIDEPFSQQQQPSDLAPSSHAAFHSLGDRATDRWNNESDDEDDGGDQVLAQSLKRLQEWVRMFSASFCFVNCAIFSSVDRSIDWLTDWWMDCSIEWSIDWLIGELFNVSLNQCLIDWLTVIIFVEFFDFISNIWFNSVSNLIYSRIQ